MKKLVVSALAFSLISFASVQAEPISQHAQTATTQVAKLKEDKVPVKPEELPEAIKKTIKGEQFSGWKVKKAFLVTEDDKTQYYELQVANGDESARVKLDKNGNNVG
ncbi:hypothetical protein [Dyadobacter sandarakinus]|uniref:PepSY domain-containing protein n=1 Tax=Dyadobacter sandarakinus TaxID=2747268 RepID=A0ABX7I1G0_9BACT|nr:hypothetical protein [Dyadobacter sandarakinus]QRQ99684.1 hypothetical protein HWI92_01520 [Dyadobacter sandarakinus]